MKLIPKRQNGGSFLSLFADYIPQQRSTQTATSKASSSEASSESPSKKDDEKGKLTERDLFTLLKDADILPNEMDALAARISNMYRTASLLGDEIDTSGIASLYTQSITRLKRADFNKKEYDKAYTTVEKNEGLNEFAVTTRGTLYAYDKDKELKEVSVSNYLANQSEYSPITNQELLWLRAWDPSFIDNNLVLNVVNNGIGISKVQELIKKSFSVLGTTETREEQYSAGLNSQIINGFEVLQQSQAVGSDVATLVKQKKITKSQEEQAQAALYYIYQTLPENAKAILQLRSGNSDDPLKGALSIIGNLIASRKNKYTEETIDIEDGGDSSDGSSSKGVLNSGLLNEDLNTAQMFIAGLGKKEQFIVNPGTNVATPVSANSLPLVKSEGDPLGAGCSLYEVSQGQFGPILDWNNVTMGGRKIDPVYLNQIIVSDGNVHSIDFPVDENGNPDLRPTTLKAKKKFDTLLIEAGIDINDPKSRAEHASEINQILEKVGLSAAYDSQGNIVSGNWGRFAVMNGTADNRALGVDPLEGESALLREVTDDYKIDSLIDTIQKKADIKKLPFDKNDMWIEGGYDMFLEGTIWIPLINNYHNAMAGSGKEMSAALNNQLDRLQQIRDKKEQLMSNYFNPGQV